MAVTALWIALLATPVVLEVVARLRGPLAMAPSRAVAALWCTWPGRVLLLVLWAFVGWHLFARYTIPR